MTVDAVTIPITLEPEIAIIGGGIAGCWLLNRLVNAGYNAILLEKNALGCEQTLASQGMIHGGMKYTLQGALTGASEAIADMPAYWQRCLKGEGDVDLSTAKILSDAFYFWSSGSFASRLTSFFASKAMSGRIDALPRKQYPSLLNHKKFSGKVYRLQDIVVDAPSVIHALTDRLSNQLWQTDKPQEWRRDGDAAILHVGHLRIKAKQFILTAGKGNGDILQQLGINSPQMQLRPLQQVWVKHQHMEPLYGHCLGADNVPRLSISSHRTKDNRMVWSLGGQVAEWGADKTPAEVIARAQKEVAELFPWLDFSDAQWATGYIERAEPKQNKMLRPDKAFAERAQGIENVIAAWPTKLTLAPNLANEVLGLLAPPSSSQTPAFRSSPFQEANIAEPPWERVFD